MSVPANQQTTLGALAKRFSLEIAEKAACRVINRLASLTNADGQSLCFSESGVRPAHLEQTKAAAVLCQSQQASLVNKNSVAIVVDQPRAVFAAIARWLYAPVSRGGRIDPSAVIDPDAQIDSSAEIGANTVIGPDVKIASGVVIGPNCLIGANVHIGAETRLVGQVTVLHDCHIGARCLIQPGVVIGSDGFGLVHERDHWTRMPQIGRVVIGDDVDIGANTAIDRGALDDTVIEQGVKLDNLIQIAHNVRVGAHSAIAGCAGLAGSSVVGRHCTLGGGVGLAGHLTLADHVHVTGMSMVTRSIHQPGVYSAGTPLDTNARWHKNAARFKKLDALFRRVRHIEQQLDDRPDKEDRT
ncbi:MAG TPA: UDP-3-O-(3-hydroxymyristoyl)glucosamine N-acyltransferase [Halothiobacillaceae bacterium]|nr:UDP-3-O-(3-hydroxymyristoyl)glucosamine N-acyltransferase [Halothiobacillaceae bacterium]